jgi:Bacitracin resistance protein BacA
MTLFQIVLLATVQGLAELLPISSSAHVIVSEKLMGLDPTALAFTFFLVMLHLGTMFGVLAYFRKRWIERLRGRAHCANFFGWYNNIHHHSGLGLLTPHDVHYGLAGTRLQARDAVLAAAYAAHPERFPAGTPSAGVVPGAVWINKPKLIAPKEEMAQ